MSDRDSVVTVDELDMEELDRDLAEKSPVKKEWQGNRDSGRRYDSFSGREREHHHGYNEREYDRIGAGGVELCTKVIFIQSKKFFLDIKDTKRGRILKISESIFACKHIPRKEPTDKLRSIWRIQMNGTKSRMTMDMRVVTEFHEKLTEFIEEYSRIGSRVASDSVKPVIRSESILSKERRYYLDLKENTRGRFLKLSMIMAPPSHERSDIVIPAQGMVDLRDVITDLLSEYGKGGVIEDEVEEKEKQEHDIHGGERESKEEEGFSLEVDGRTYYANVVSRKQGTILRLSEVKSNYRTAINVPREYWDQFLDVLKKNVDDMVQARAEALHGNKTGDKSETTHGNGEENDDAWT